MGDDKHRPAKRRHDDESESDEKRSRRDKKEKKEKKKEKKKSHKHRRRDESESESDDDDDDELVQKAKKLIQNIDEDDYFNKSTEFRVWLLEEKGKYFEDLGSSAKAHSYFSKFVKAWNSYKLSGKYYNGIRSSEISATEKTRHKWVFKNVNPDDVIKVKDSVDTMNLKGGESSKVKPARRTYGPTMPPSSTGQVSGRRDDDKDMDDEDRRGYNRALNREARNRENDTREAILDELAPKETGREAMIAKRRAQNQRLHKDRDYDVEINEKDLMGGDDFHSRLAAQKRSQAARDNIKAQKQQEKAVVMAPKVEEFKKKEDATMAMFRKMAEDQKKRGGLGMRPPGL